MIKNGLNHNTINGLRVKYSQIYGTINTDYKNVTNCFLFTILSAKKFIDVPVLLKNMKDGKYDNTSRVYDNHIINQQIELFISQVQELYKTYQWAKDCYDVWISTNILHSRLNHLVSPSTLQKLSVLFGARKIQSKTIRNVDYWLLDIDRMFEVLFFLYYIKLLKMHFAHIPLDTRLSLPQKNHKVYRKIIAAKPEDVPVCFVHLFNILKGK